MNKAKQPTVWIHICVSGGLVQRVSADLSAQVIIENFDTNSTEPSLALLSAEALSSSDLVALLTKLKLPHRIVIATE
jgi:hypothetical protein